jgi:preprotein translocase subunit SecA
MSRSCTLEGDALDASFGIQVLAEVPHMLDLLDKFRGRDNREATLARYRESLADDADFLFGIWAGARAQSPSRPPEATFRREAPKVGRNDPCPCGSGKKNKKCCATESRDSKDLDV